MALISGSIVRSGDQQSLVDDDQELGPVAGLELAQQATHVGPCGGRAEVEPLGEFRVGPPLATSVNTSRSRPVRTSRGTGGRGSLAGRRTDELMSRPGRAGAAAASPDRHNA